MKKLIFPILLILISSCASQKTELLHISSKPVVLDSVIAIYDTECRIIKHDSKDQYRLTMYGKSYNNYWYAEEEVELLYQRFVSQGRCQ